MATATTATEEHEGPSVSRSGYARLPSALVAATFAFLELADHCRFERVDRRHARLSRLDAASPAHVVIEAPAQVVPDNTQRIGAVFARFARYRPRTIRLVVRSLHDAHTSALVAMPHVSENLRELELECASYDETAPLDLAFLAHLPRLCGLTHSAWMYTAVTPRSLTVLDALANLTRLELDALTVDGCRQLPTRLERLVLHEIDAPHPRNARAAYERTGGAMDADTVRQRQSHFDNWLARLAQMRRMTHLVLGDNPAACSVEYQLDSWRYALSDFAAWMPQLVTLKLAACLAPQRADPPLAFPALRVLAYGPIDRAYTRHSYAPALAVPTLEEFRVHAIERAGQNVLAVGECNVLHRMATRNELERYGDHVLYYRAFSTAVVDAIVATAPKRLVTLDLSAADHVDDAMLERLVRSGVPIRDLHLSGCVTTLAPLARLSTLTSLALGVCPELHHALLRVIDERDKRDDEGCGYSRDGGRRRDDGWLDAVLPPLPHVTRFRVPHFGESAVRLFQSRYAHATVVDRQLPSTASSLIGNACGHAH